MIAHIFVDAENVPADTGLLAVEVFGRKYEIKKVDIITQVNTMPAHYRNLDNDLYRVQNCNHGKNMADTWLCVEIAKTIFEEPETEIIIIISNDRDFLPAVKLSVERGKKVVMVSNSDITNIKNLLKSVSADSKSVEVVDYREWVVYGILSKNNSEENKIYVEKFENLVKKYPDLSASLRRYFAQNIRELKYIFIKYDGKIYEIPFVNGKSINFLMQTVRELKLIQNHVTQRKFAAKNLLKLEEFTVSLFSPEEMEIINEGIPAKFDKIFLPDILAAFSLNLKKLTTIFVKTGKGIVEAPFVNGMNKTDFDVLLRRMKIKSEKKSSDYFLKENLLKVENGKIYVMTEQEIEELEEETKKAETFFEKVSGKRVSIFIKHNGKIHEIFFVNGMTVDKFSRYLRENKIIGKNAAVTKILEKNFLKLESGRVYLNTEKIISD